MATELSNEDIFTLTEIGYACVMYGVNADVEPIFETLNMLYPDNTAGAIGHAIIYLNRGNFDAAIEVLQSCLQQCSTNTEEAQAILMLAMYMGGRNEEAAALASEAGDQSGVANAMADSLFNDNQ